MGSCCGDRKADEARQSLLAQDRAPVRDSRSRCLGSSQPAIEVNPGVLDFGQQRTGQWTATRDVVVRNGGAASLRLDTVTLSDEVQYELQLPDNARTPLDPGDTRTVRVRFRPSAVGPRPATATVASNDPRTPNVVVNLSGSGVAPRIVVPAAIAFGRLGQGATDTRRVIVRNEGGAPLTIQDAVLDGTHHAMFAVQPALNAPLVIPARDQAELRLTFTPNANGDKVARLTLNSDDPATPAAQIDLTGTGVTRLVRAHLDEDRDGNVDDLPAETAQWQWGEHGKGAILCVRHGYPRTGAGLPDANGVVPERRPLTLRWTGPVPADDQGWSAVLEVSRPEAVRVHLSDRFGGGGIAGTAPLALPAGRVDLTARLANQANLTLWLEAASYQLGAGDTYSSDEARWRVTLTLTFTDGGHQILQQAVQVRIAPWIMAGDLEPTEALQFKDFAPSANLAREAYRTALPAAMRQVLPATCTPVIAPPLNDNPKAFARDVQKAGFVTAPGVQQVVLVRDLDNQSPLASMTNSILTSRPALRAVRTQAPGVELSGQSGGGNLLVTPPLPNHPHGRIVYGESAQRPCELGDFLGAQRYQAPIVLDSSWLYVGHVDEYVSFLPDSARRDGWDHKVLLASARLAHALCHLASARPDTDRVDDDIRTAIRLSEEARVAGRHLVRTEDLEAAFGAAGAAGDTVDTARAAGYVANPGVPAGMNGRFVRWSDGAAFPSEPAANYLANAGPVNERWITFATTAQTAVDADRGRLQPALGVGQANFVELPVTFGYEGGALVGRSADSVNMLILNNGGAPVCLVPKPFGPVAGGVYLFERCITLRLAPFGGPALHFINDWEGLHVLDGEIHCGTNQIPRARAVPWWHAQP